MSIRRGRRKQVINLVNEEEERAKERLFEISYFDDLKPYDESHILLANRGRQVQSILEGKTAKLGITNNLNKKKSQSLGVKSGQPINIEKRKNLRGGKTLFLETLQQNAEIFNTLQSNRVFVGNKNALIKSAREQTSPSIISINKKRIETMPAIKQKSYLQLSIKENSSIKGLKIKVDYPLTNKGLNYQKLQLAGHFTHKNVDRQNYMKLKYKLKRDLFNTLEQKLVICNKI